MARSFPADVKLQSFFTEQYEKENTTRLKWFLDKQRGAAQSAASGPTRVRGANVPDGLPKVNPLAFSRNMKLEEEKMMQEIQELARKQQYKEMWKAPRDVRETLYTGFTKEEKGRYQYLKQRKDIIPEKKFSFPMLSSWDYGWKLDEQFKLKRPTHARTRLIQDSFFTRNRVPALADPTIGPTLERSKTIIC